MNQGQRRSKLILASASPARRNVLAAAGVEFSVQVSAIDEAAIKNRMSGYPPEDIAQTLADAKAEDISSRPNNAGRHCIGADQILCLGDRLFDKPVDMAAARETLVALRGQQHRLISAVSVAKDNDIIWRFVDVARMTMRDFSDAFLEYYLELAGAEVMSSVGAYRIEGVGVQLFSHIEGDHTTILGLPVLPLLAALRAEGEVKS